MARLYSSKAEAIAIRGMCSRNPSISGYIFSQLDETYFYNQEAIEAFHRVRTHIQKRGEPPAFTLLREDLTISENAREFIGNAEAPVKTTEQAEQLISNLDKYRKTRLMYKLAEGILNQLQGVKIDPDTLLEKISRRVAKISTRRSMEDTVWHIGRDSNIMKVVEELLYGEKSDDFIPTGFKTFDTVNGGVFRGSVFTIGGSSGAGKSTLAGQISTNMAMRGYKVVQIPLEMNEIELTGRTIAHVAQMDNTKILLKRLASGERDEAYKKFRRFDRAIEKAGGRLTIFKPKEDITLEGALAATHAFGADVEVVDYISLLAGLDTDDQWRILGAIARTAKVYADAHRKAIILLAQVNDDGRIRYSQAIKEHSSLAWTFVATKQSREQGFLNIEQIKARNQVMFPFTLKIDYSTQTVRDLEAEEIDDIQSASSDEAQEKVRKGGKKNKFSQPHVPPKQGKSSDYMPDLSE